MRCGCKHHSIKHSSPPRTGECHHQSSSPFTVNILPLYFLLSTHTFSPILISPSNFPFAFACLEIRLTFLAFFFTPPALYGPCPSAPPLISPFLLILAHDRFIIIFISYFIAAVISNKILLVLLLFLMSLLFMNASLWFSFGSNRFVSLIKHIALTAPHFYFVLLFGTQFPTKNPVAGAEVLHWLCSGMKAKMLWRFDGKPFRGAAKWKISLKRKITPEISLRDQAYTHLSALSIPPRLSKAGRRWIWSNLTLECEADCIQNILLVIIGEQSQ